MTTRKTRAGRNIWQLQGYKAFIPAPLPPDPPPEIDAEMQGLLSSADRALGRLDGSVQTLPDPDMFVFMYVRKEAVLSSQIEGTLSSLDDLLNAEAKIFDPERPGDVDEVINYVNAMNYGLKRLAEIPVSVRLIREIHERLLTGVRGSERQPGELRKTQNWIGPSGATLADATFVPPPPDEVPVALSSFEKFIHGEDVFPALVKIGLAHAQFETIHPFLDGNGRMGRLLITFMLCEKDDTAEASTLSLSLFSPSSIPVLRYSPGDSRRWRLGGLDKLLPRGHLRCLARGYRDRKADSVLTRASQETYYRGVRSCSRKWAQGIGRALLIPHSDGQPSCENNRLKLHCGEPTRR